MQGIREVTQPFTLNRQERGIQATKIYYYDPDDGDHDDDVPAIGDTFDYPLVYEDPSFPVVLEDHDDNKLYCISVETSVISKDNRKFMYTCEYANDPIDPAIFTGSSASVAPDCEMRIEHSAESNNVTINSQNPTAWVWQADGTSLVGQTIGKKTNLQSVRIVRYVNEAGWTQFEKNVLTLVGSINKDTSVPWEDNSVIDTGNWLFESCRSEKFYNHHDKPTYKAELAFTRRVPSIVDGDVYSGWNQILRNTMNWDAPKRASDSQFLYRYGEFLCLFNGVDAPDPTLTP